jgi:hypothetical protein
MHNWKKVGLKESLKNIKGSIAFINKFKYFFNYQKIPHLLINQGIYMHSLNLQMHSKI